MSQTCSVCERVIGKHAKLLSCSCCGKSSHISCNSPGCEEVVITTRCLKCVVQPLVSILQSKRLTHKSCQTIEPENKKLAEKSVQATIIKQKVSRSNQTELVRTEPAKPMKIFREKYSQTSVFSSSEPVTDKLAMNLNNKNLLPFFTNFDLPQVVVLYLGSPELVEKNSFVQKFICNSLILSIHSDTFHNIISSGSTTIYLEGYNTLSDANVVRKCIEFMYGETSGINDQADLNSIMKFASVWAVSSLCQYCIAAIERKITTNHLALLHHLSLLDIVTAKSTHYFEIIVVFRNVIRTYADDYIKHFIENRQFLETLAERVTLFQELISNSYSSQCALFLTLLLAASERSKKVVFKSLHLIRVESVFSGIFNFSSFQNILYSYCVMLDGSNKDLIKNIRLLKSRVDKNITASGELKPGSNESRPSSQIQSYDKDYSLLNMRKGVQNKSNVKVPTNESIDSYESSASLSNLDAIQHEQNSDGANLKSISSDSLAKSNNQQNVLNVIASGDFTSVSVQTGQTREDMPIGKKVPENELFSSDETSMSLGNLDAKQDEHHSGFTDVKSVSSDSISKSNDVHTDIDSEEFQSQYDLILLKREQISKDDIPERLAIKDQSENQIKTKKSKKIQDKTVKRVLSLCQSRIDPLEKLMKQVEAYPVFQRIELLAHTISCNKSSSNTSTLLEILSNAFVCPSMVDCLRAELKYTDLTKLSPIEDKLLNSIFCGVEFLEHLNVASLVATFESRDEFLKEYNSSKVIKLQNSSVTCNFKGQETVQKEQPINFYIAFRENNVLEFGSQESYLKTRHIIHCYLLGFDELENIIKYISVFQQHHSTINKIAQNCKKIKVIIVFSKDMPSCAKFSGIVVSNLTNVQRFSNSAVNNCNKLSVSTVDQLLLPSIDESILNITDLIQRIENIPIYAKMEMLACSIICSAGIQSVKEQALEVICHHMQNPIQLDIIRPNLKATTFRSFSDRIISLLDSLFFSPGNLSFSTFSLIAEFDTAGGFLGTLHQQKKIAFQNSISCAIQTDNQLEYEIAISNFDILFLKNGVSFTSSHKLLDTESILHCYLLTIDDTDHVTSYISLLQQSCPEVHTQVWPSLKVKVVVIFSKDRQANCAEFEGVIIPQLKSKL